MTLKIAGVHWWYRTRAHAAELTAGYFNAGDRDGYRDILQLCAKYSAAFTLTCIEMCDSQHPPEALCGPEGLLRQVTCEMLIEEAFRRVASLDWSEHWMKLLCRVT